MRIGMTGMMGSRMKPHPLIIGGGYVLGGRLMACALALVSNLDEIAKFKTIGKAFKDKQIIACITRCAPFKAQAMLSKMKLMLAFLSLNLRNNNFNK